MSQLKTKVVPFTLIVTLLALVFSWLTVRGTTTAGIVMVELRLASNPFLFQRLETYSQSGQQVSTSLSWTESVKPVVNGIDFFRDIGVWDNILKEHPDLRIGLESTLKITKFLIRLREKSSALTQLSETAQSGRTFLLNPSEKTLLHFGYQSAESAVILDMPD